VSKRTSLGIKIVIFAIGIGTAAYFFFQTIGWFWNPPLLKNNTEAFLEQIRKQDFNEAMNRFEDSTANNSWPNDMRELFEKQDFKLLTFDGIRAEFDDGSYSTGHAELTFEIDSRPIRTEVILTFGNRGKPKQLCAITPPGVQQSELPELEEWNRLMCGGSF
jgi:hypothetical protein